MAEFRRVTTGFQAEVRDALNSHRLAHAHGRRIGRAAPPELGDPRRRARERLVGDGELFVLKVVGDSMIEAAICDGDWVTVRRQPVAENGDIVAAMLDGEATVKRFKREDGHVWLLPHNSAYQPIPGDEATILGKVVAVLRRV